MAENLNALIFWFVMYVSLTSWAQAHTVHSGEHPSRLVQDSFTLPFTVEDNAIIAKTEIESLKVGLQVEFEKPLSANGENIRDSKSILIKSIGPPTNNLLKLITKHFGYQYDGQTVLSEVRFPVVITNTTDNNKHKFRRLLLNSKTDGPLGSLLLDFDNSDLIFVKHSASSMALFLLELTSSREARPPSQPKEGIKTMPCIFDVVAERYICKQL
ncbi:hypothetical protein [Salinimonas iocasae]|uniref:Uncharacterized protein n=1 Tax=Salinimonas iocasae TaxID=2572577 RepID=A0A5B7Y9K5_9ALTE|nr:hypothetical protein [Salinimonas iocasae]QCZ92138.1 hypothetical protein FBQ74_01005 [Salinimonas iocasae]